MVVVFVRRKMRSFRRCGWHTAQAGNDVLKSFGGCSPRFFVMQATINVDDAQVDASHVFLSMVSCREETNLQK